jgi:probable F420-dependent oxidoreductase
MSEPCVATTARNRPMKFGIATFVTDEGISPLVLGPALEERGFDSVFLAEHSHIPTSRQSPYPAGGDLPRKYYRTLDPFVALTATASVTSRLLVGTGIALLPQRDVIHLAKEVASVDLVSGGRFQFGVGVGWNREEMRNHGTDPKTRGALMDEMLGALIGIWTSDEAEFHGSWISTRSSPGRNPYSGRTRPSMSAARVMRHWLGWRASVTPGSRARTRRRKSSGRSGNG